MKQIPATWHLTVPGICRCGVIHFYRHQRVTKLCRKCCEAPAWASNSTFLPPSIKRTNCFCNVGTKLWWLVFVGEVGYTKQGRRPWRDLQRWDTSHIQAVFFPFSKSPLEWTINAMLSVTCVVCGLLLLLMLTENEAAFLQKLLTAFIWKKKQKKHILTWQK